MSDGHHPNGADALIRALQREGSEYVFGYPGGAVMPLYDALHRAGDRAPKHILVRHEQAAALAADGWARASGEVGVCLATSGPGATNLITGIANAHLDSVPVVAITGQVATGLLGTDAFQEVDTFSMAMPIVKHSFRVRDAASVAPTVHRAFDIAREGRPGPVLIDLPKDVQLAAAGPDRSRPHPRRPVPRASELELERARQAVASAHRPVVYAGGGVELAGASARFREFVESSQIPVVCTLKGLGLLPDGHHLFMGMLGMHGTRAANLCVQEADLLIVVGARFDDRATGVLARFAPHARVVHLDVDPAEVGKLRAADTRLLGELGHSLTSLARPAPVERWRDRCRARRSAERRAVTQPPGPGVYAPALLHELSRAFDIDPVIAADVGQHQMWVAQHCHFASPRSHLTSGGLGTMGFGLPAAIGAGLARPDTPTLCVTGDGSIMMNVQELATIVRYALPIKILLIDNSCLGMVRQWQELFFDARYSEVDLSDNPDFVRVAEALGVPAFRLDARADVGAAVDRIVRSEGPLLCHCVIDPAQNVWPLVPPGHSNATMLDASPGPVGHS